MQEHSLPILDIAHLLSKDPENINKRQTFITALRDACYEYGFFYLNISSFVDMAEPEELVRLARQFFELPQAEKDKLSLKSGDRARGYAKLNENVTNGLADNHEGLDFYRPVENPNNTMSLWGINQWPDIPHFREKYEAWIRKMKTLGILLIKAMALGLSMKEEDWPELYYQLNDPFWVMRIIGYPPLPDSHEGYSCGAHKDYGCLTLLYQDPTPNALQVFLKKRPPLYSPEAVADLSGQSTALAGGEDDGVWINADPVPGCIVCNIGEMWELWSDGLYRSTLHRVVHKSSNYRVSIPFFYEPNFDTVIAPLEAAVDFKHNLGVKDFVEREAVLYGEFLIKKVDNNFADDEEKSAELVESKDKSAV